MDMPLTTFVNEKPRFRECKPYFQSVHLPRTTLATSFANIIYLLLCATDEKVEISVVFDDQLVIITAALANSVTNKSSLRATRTHPQAHGKGC